MSPVVTGDLMVKMHLKFILKCHPKAQSQCRVVNIKIYFIVRQVSVI